MISLRNFALRRGERLLLSNVDLTLHAGYRVGVVGRNGTGKSSLFAAIKGELEADKGDVDLPGLRMLPVDMTDAHSGTARVDFSIFASEDEEDGLHGLAERWAAAAKHTAAPSAPTGQCTHR